MLVIFVLVEIHCCGRYLTKKKRKNIWLNNNRKIGPLHINTILI